MRKTICILLTIVLTVCLLPAGVLAADTNSGTCGEDAYWEYDDASKTLSVYGTGSIKGYSTERCGPWKQYITKVEHIVISEGITAVGYSAFEGCYQLEELELPSTLRKIDQNAFYECEYSLDRVIIPASVTYIGCNAFAGYTMGYEPDHVTYIYFMGDAPNTVKPAGKINNSFSEFTTLYYLPGTSGWTSPKWNGYNTQTWDGYNIIDPNGMGVTEPEKGDEPIQDSGDIFVEVTGTVCYDYAYQVANQVNSLRRELGLNELVVDQTLMDVAMRRAAECSVYYSHTRPNDTDFFSIFPRASVVAENIAAGQTYSEIVMSQWEASPGHYANMIDARFTSIGVGCFYINGTYYWTQSFSTGSPSRAAVEQDKSDSFSVPVNDGHFSLVNSSKDITLELEETKRIELRLYNTGFGAAQTPVTVEGVDARCEGDSVEFDPDTLLVKAVSAGTSNITLRLPGGRQVEYRITVNGKPCGTSRKEFQDVPAGSWYYDAVGYVSENGYMNGLSATIFAPNGTVTRGMVVQILYNMEGGPGGYRSSFKDVERGAWYYDAVSWASSVGIVSGYGGGRFGPKDPVTREQLAVMLCNYAAYQDLETTGQADLSKFTDRDTVSTFALKSVQWAVSSGLLNGISSTCLALKGNTTRAQLAAIIQRFCTRY